MAYKKHFEFHVYTSGYGEVTNQAWPDAVRVLADDSGERCKIITEEDADWYGKDDTALEGRIVIV
jgi:hypothetical protein